MIIIPARLASTRFKDKILAPIGGVPMFVATAKNVSQVDNVLVAVDDEKVYDIALKYGLKAVMTSQEHKSGTDRINEASQNAKLSDDEVLINVQADEPFFESENLVKFKDFATRAIQAGAFMASAYKIISQDDAKDPNLVKVVLDKDKFALYFSRSILPYPRSECDRYLGHIGIYAYSVRNLREFCGFGDSFLENTEKLEQLRALENGKKIAMCEIKTNSMGIDTQADYERALREFVK